MEWSMKIDKITTDDDLIDFLLDQHKQTCNPHFMAAAHTIERYRRAYEIFSWQLSEYEDLKEQCRLVILPCKIGTRVYRIVPDSSVTWPDPPEYKVIWDTFRLQDVNAFGKTVFLSEEEALKNK
jgi:hypothetical protein